MQKEGLPARGARTAVVAWQTIKLEDTKGMQ